jgi:hypothetical protein
MLLGYFMTLIDWTAVSVANPSIMAALHSDYESVVWSGRHGVHGEVDSTRHGNLLGVIRNSMPTCQLQSRGVPDRR